MPADPVVIAGAGPGGLAAAITLTRAGRAVRLLERAPALRTGGGALVLWPNGTRALQSLIGPGPLPGAAYARNHVRRWDGALLHDLPIGAHAEVNGGPVVALRRGELIAALAAVAPPVSTATTLASWTQDADGVDVLLDSGERVRASALVGADGLHSRVAAGLDDVPAPRRAGLHAWLGESPDGGPVAADVMTTTVGRGLRFLHLPRGDGGAWWYAYTHDNLGIHTQAALRRALRDWHAPIADVVASTPADMLIHVPLQDRPPRPRIHDGRVALLGDAAHPVTPDLGQGACLALEDALLLGRCFLRDDAPDAVRVYAGHRATRTSTVQAASRMVSQLTFPRSTVASTLRDEALAATPATHLLMALGWLYGSP